MIDGVTYYFGKLLLVLKTTPILTSLMIILGTILSPYVSLIYLLLAMVMIDMITGIWCSVKTKLEELKPNTLKNKLLIIWQTIESRKLRYTIEKLLVYMITILITACFEYYYIPISIGGYTLSKLILGIVTLTEVKSILENCSKITKNQLFAKLFSLFKKKVEDTTQVDLTQYTSESIDNLNKQ